MMHVATLLSWVDRHPFAYFLPVVMLVALALGLALRSLWRDDPAATKQHDWAWSWLILAILVAGRWPSLLFPREFNSDENMLLAGAHALTHDPVFWRSVCGGTAGPLDFFALWPAGWLCGWEGYLAARLTALGLIALGLILAHQGMALLLGRASARLAGLAGICLEAMTSAFDLLHYSTELVPIALIAGASYAAIRRWSAPGNPWWSAWGGLLLGAVPMSKWQAGPLAAALGLCWLWAELRHKGPGAPRYRTYLLAGALLPTACFVGQVLLTGEWESFSKSYVLFNLDYTAGSAAPLWPTVYFMWRVMARADSLLQFWLAGCALWIVLMVRFRPAADRATRWLLLAALAAVAISLTSILLPRRPFLHYWQLLIVPGGFLLGLVLKNFLATTMPHGRTAARWLVSVCAVVLVGLMLMHRGQRLTSFIGTLADYQQSPRSELATHVAHFARPGDALAVWGFTDDVYVETGLRQATRYAHIMGLVNPGPQYDYYRARFLADLLQAPPALFLDSVRVSTPPFPAGQLAHEKNFPELGAMIRAEYVLVAQSKEAWIYQRRDLVGR